MDSNVSAENNIDFNLEALINFYQEYYYNSEGVVAIRVYQQNTGLGQNTLSVDQVKVKFITAYIDQYQNVSSIYIPTYEGVGNDYRPTYKE